MDLLGIALNGKVCGNVMARVAAEFSSERRRFKQTEKILGEQIRSMRRSDEAIMIINNDAGGAGIADGNERQIASTTFKEADRESFRKGAGKEDVGSLVNGN